ncbi:MAG TPA: PKD domain-containing protein [Flavisolibacter sp.]|jgi:gliding motility-associated-like protein|nr:PKD domain-containing protein [Flavisolibacter sp.]
MNALVRNHRRSLLLILFCCLHAAAWAQIKADFTATPRSGCSPLVVYFSDSSTGNPTKWKWDLGNGVTSILRNPSATYFNPGTYTVKLIASNAAGADSVVKTEYVTVYASPKVSFTQDKSGGCFPLPVQFTDNSTAGSGNIVSWQWDFGDGNTSTERNPSHLYTSAGNALVTLRVTNSFGCATSFTSPQPIVVSNGVKAGFTHMDAGPCPAPVTVQFNNTSTGTGPLTYHWSFGDNTSSSAFNPSHTYRSNGTYTVSLKVTSAQGCVDSIRKEGLINIGSTKAGFSAPAAGCVNEPVQFTNTLSSAVSVQWNFGDGTTSSELNPSKQYVKEGTYTVQLISNFGACQETTEKQITITQKAVAGFTAAQQTFCSLPATVQFRSIASGNNLQYEWHFGDSTTGTGATPVHTYSREGSYTVTLIVTNEGGCSDTLIKENFITIQQPNLALQGLPQSGCIPLTVTPTATLAPGQTITRYAWNFGDGTTSTLVAPSHTYTQPGTYTISLVVTTAGGCTDTVVMERAVRVGEKPKAAFVNYPLIVCAFEMVAFTDKTTGPVDQWLWDFGGGMFSTEQHPIVPFSDTGWHTVTLISYSNTCADTIVIPNAVYVNPPASIFTPVNNCENRYTKYFRDESLGAKSWFWDFGDGTTSTEQAPTHTYARPGTYTVWQTVTNGTCTHSSPRVVRVIDEKATLTTSDTILCRNQSATFTAQGITGGNIASWQWDFGDGSHSADSATTSHAYAQTGAYTVTLTITDLLGCKSSYTVPVTVYGPTANFETVNAASCLQDNRITFNETSVTDGQHPIVKRIWNYGDNAVDSTSAAPYQHSYTAAGTYQVSLTVVDDYGCRASKSIPAAVLIAQPQAAFGVSDSTSCIGKNIKFTNTSAGIEPTYTWSFGDGNISTAVTPVHAYSKTGIYTIKLVATDKYGCKDSLTKTNLVTISYPKAKLAVSDSIGTCPPLMVRFTNLSTDYTHVTWDFGDGTHSKLDTPSHFYTAPGTYIAMLIATGPGGCTDTVRQKIVVKGPSGSFTYSPLVGCNPLTVNFTASTKNSTSVIWDFSDGSTAPSQGTTTSHTYVYAGDFVPKLIVTDEAGCSVPILGKDTIRVKSVAASFDISASSFCNNGQVQFTNKTVSNDYITDYQWSFGDGSTSAAMHPVHHYSKAGNYTVQLKVTTQAGCTDDYVLTDTIAVYNNPAIAIMGDSAACAPAALTFRGVVLNSDPSSLQWAWNMANGQTSTVQNPVQQTYSAEGTYFVTAIATNKYGCRDTATKAITVSPVPKTNAGADQWICHGSAAQLKATGATTYTWQASPTLNCTSCDSPQASPTDSTQYIVTGYNSFGCSSTDSVTIRVHQPITLQVGRGDTICVGETRRLVASGADLYNWSPSIGIKDPTSGTTTVTPEASVLYKVIGRDKAGCFSDTGSVYIKVSPRPTVAIDDVITLPVGNSVTLKPQYSQDVSTYQWSQAQTLSCANCPYPSAKPKTETTYSITVKNDGGCVAKDEITVQVVCNGGNLFIPNTFSPNNDGTNEQFYPRGSGLSRIKSLTIFNRWGEIVFSREDFNANDAAAGWNGTFKGRQLASDVYVYICEVVCMNNEVLSYKGNVTLLR